MQQHQYGSFGIGHPISRYARTPAASLVYRQKTYGTAKPPAAARSRFHSSLDRGRVSTFEIDSTTAYTRCVVNRDRQLIRRTNMTLQFNNSASASWFLYPVADHSTLLRAGRRFRPAGTSEAFRRGANAGQKIRHVLPVLVGPAAVEIV